MHESSTGDAREIDLGQRGFADGLLVDLVAVLRDLPDGALLTIVGTRDDVDRELHAWSRLTGHAIVSSSLAGAVKRWTVRKGAAHYPDEPARTIGSRMWIYSNFDCNLRCDYCCVRSSPKTPRRALGVDRVKRIVQEARAIPVREFFVTGGEPFLLHDIGEIIGACASVAPTTVLTNGMMFSGARAAILRDLPKERVVFQISMDSATPELHDLHRGAGTWNKAWTGVQVARSSGFRVRLAATVRTEAEDARFRAFLDEQGIAEDDRVIRRVAMRGFATSGVALSKRDLVPEVTVTDAGIYWHPVGATDDDFLVTREIFPLEIAIEAVRAQWRKEREVDETVAEIFRCA